MALDRIGDSDSSGITRKGTMTGKKSGSKADFSTPSLSSAVNFESLLSQDSEQKGRHSPTKHKLQELLEGFQITERELAENPSYPRFIQYKNQIQKLLDQVIAEGYAHRNIKQKDREFNVVVRINHEVAAILQEVQKNKKEMTVILEAMGQINGYILDLMC